MPVTIDGSAGISGAPVSGTTGTFSGNISGADGAFSGNVTANGLTTELRPLVMGTAQSASGTAIDFTDIPSWVKRVTVMFTGVSIAAGTADLRFQLGDSGGVETTGYTSSMVDLVGNAIGNSSSTSGFDTSGIIFNSVTATVWGRITFTKVTGDTWVADGLLGSSNPRNAVIAGSKTLSATLDRVRFTTVAGTATFDAGSINVMYE